MTFQAPKRLLAPLTRDTITTQDVIDRIEGLIIPIAACMGVSLLYSTHRKFFCVTVNGSLGCNTTKASVAASYYNSRVEEKKRAIRRAAAKSGAPEQKLLALPGST